MGRTVDEPAAPPRAGRGIGLLLLAGLVGVPVSAAAFLFLALLHRMTAFVWEDLPGDLGLDPLPWWWPVPWLLAGGLLAGTAISRLPGRGGHVPIDGLSAAPVPPKHLPGVLLAALGALPLGAVLGPEAPLMAVGGATALLLTRRWTPDARSPEAAVVGTAGAAAAVSVIFGSPLVAGVFILEAAAASGAKAVRAVLPCLLAAGVGAIVFTGLGDWTGLPVASLSLPGLDAASLHATDLLWTVPAAAVIALGMREVRALGRRLAPVAERRPMAMALTAVAVTAVCAAAYTLLTGRPPVEVLLSGQDSLAELSADPASLTAWALVAMIACKGLAYAVSLAALRGGPIFPAVFLGAAAGVLLSALPGFGAVPALAAGMAAATAAVMPLPVSAAVLVTLLLGADAAATAPVVIAAVVVATAAGRVLDRPRPAEAAP
ncbi:chloride channel protein [Glycomyces terrestris]|uniref:Chloride channel protein n=1 Tax=Glycomyces terrestris TaxID=2493553 RepID=A0A426UVY3_9ACTN|nr:chloride channel protein [Glycomyces terrestris]RRR98505.1 chloride channel protein [Glycomyces terrestris]